MASVDTAGPQAISETLARGVIRACCLVEHIDAGGWQRAVDAVIRGAGGAAGARSRRRRVPADPSVRIRVDRADRIPIRVVRRRGFRHAGVMDAIRL